jgi:alpha-L-rhamnosidase
VRGPVRAGWTRQPDRFLLELEIPANASARVHVPVAGGGRVLESGRPVDQCADIQLLGHADGYAIFAVGSGKYKFEAGKP